MAPVQDYKDSLKEKAEKLILTDFPEKILRLNQLLETNQFQNRNLADVHQDLNIPVPPPASQILAIGNYNSNPNPNANANSNAKRPRTDGSETTDRDSSIEGTRVYALPNGTVTCNQPLSDLIHLVKPHIRELVEDANLLKMWISFMIPKIEDGNNFGVSVQEDTLGEIQSVESEAAAFFDQISRYFISRAKVVSKVAKYPHIDDYRRAVQELDEKEYLSLWLVMCEIRNRYCTLHDVIIKNLEKIKKPRSSNTETLY